MIDHGSAPPMEPIVPDLTNRNVVVSSTSQSCKSYCMICGSNPEPEGMKVGNSVTTLVSATTPHTNASIDAAHREWIEIKSSERSKTDTRRDAAIIPHELSAAGGIIESRSSTDLP